VPSRARASIPLRPRRICGSFRRSLPHTVESRTEDAILARMLIGDGVISEAEALATEATARELDLPLARILLARGRVPEDPPCCGRWRRSTTRRSADARRIACPIRAWPASMPRDDLALAGRRPCHGGRRTATIVATARPDLSTLVRAAADRHTPPHISNLASPRRHPRGPDEALGRGPRAGGGDSRAGRPVLPHVAARRVLSAAVVTVAVSHRRGNVPRAGRAGGLRDRGLAFTANITLKASAFAAVLLRPDQPAHTPRPPPDIAPHLLRPPVVSILVPMFEEAEIAERLVTHLGADALPARTARRAAAAGGR
jgi:hypothetical protein